MNHFFTTIRFSSKHRIKGGSIHFWPQRMNRLDQKKGEKIKPITTNTSNTVSFYFHITKKISAAIIVHPLI